jgi:7,8-dihydropterin-6-yl-methyl-4-(beta-D-ribofuranosyl)aminobenzene 5'-phosphate synthase
LKLFVILILITSFPGLVASKATNQRSLLTKQHTILDSSDRGVDSVKFTVLIDNYPNGTLNAPWGLSILVETPNLTILFDTGPDLNALLENVEILGLNLDQIDLVVISHGHADHVEGLSYVAEQIPCITVFIPAAMSSAVKQRITGWNVTMEEIDSTYSISDDIAIIGGLYYPVNEQALAINVKNLGLIIFVGCSHPGVDNIVQRAIDDLGIQPYAVIGGFHMVEADIGAITTLMDELLAMNLTRICPTHCSGDAIRNYLQTNYPLYYEEIKVSYSTSFQGNGLTTSGLTTSTERADSPGFELLFTIGGLISLLVITRKKKLR